MRNYSEKMAEVTNELINESDRFMKDTLNLIPSSELLSELDPKTYEVFQKSIGLVDSSKRVVTAQLEYYSEIESKLNRILDEIEELKRLQAVKATAKEK